MIEFDSLTHTYKNNGVIVPSVTQVLESCFPFPEYIPKAKRQYALDLGTAVDLMVEYDLAGTLNTDTLGMLELYYQCWLKAKKDLQIKDGYTKVMFYSKDGYCGTADVVDFTISKRLIEMKTGKEYIQHKLQTAAYAHGLDAVSRFVVYLSDGEPKIVEHTSENDFKVFLACLEVFKFKHEQS